MRVNSDLPHSLLHATACLVTYLTCLLPTSAFSQEANDPWFEEQKERELTGAEAEEPEKSQALIQRRASPQAVYNALLKEYERAPESALTERIELLSRALNTLPNKKDKKLSQELTALKQQRQALLTAIDEGATADSLDKAFAAIARHNRVLNADLALSQELINSPLADRIALEAKQASDQSNYVELAKLRNLVEESGLEGLLGHRISPLVQNSENSIIFQKWQLALGSEPALSGERFLLKRALDEKDEKLRIALNIENHNDPRLNNSLRTSLTRRAGDSIEPAAPEEADLSLTLKLDQFDRFEQTKETAKESTIPGRIEEKENPDFIEAVAKYEKQAKRYERAMEIYEDDYDNWLSMYEDENPEFSEATESAEQKLDSAVAAASSNTNPFAEAGLSLAVKNAQAEYNFAQAAEMNNMPYQIPEPVKPQPFHLETLQEVYQTPSTLIVSKEETPYEYTEQAIKTTFKGAATLALDSKKLDLPVADVQVNLDRERSWIKNVDVNPRDPAVNEGSYSEEAVRSTEDLFYLELASECIKRLESMLANSSGTLLQKGLDENSRQSVVFALSLIASQSDFNLPSKEVERLVQLARDDAFSPSAFRQVCLASIAKTALSNDPEKAQQAAAILAM